MTDVAAILKDDANALLTPVCQGILKESLSLPGPDFIDRVMAASDRSPRVLCNLQRLFGPSGLGGTGYLSIRPVDQGVALSLVFLVSCYYYAVLLTYLQAYRDSEELL